MGASSASLPTGPAPQGAEPLCVSGTAASPLRVGRATLFNGDCSALMADLPKADVVIMDPPYGVGIKYGPNYDDARKDYWDWFRDTLAGIRAYCPHVLFTHRVAALRHIHDADWVSVWHKPGSFGARVGNSYVLPHWEPIFMYGIHGTGTKSAYMADVISINPEKANAGISGMGREKWDAEGFAAHPTPKPIALMKKLISVAAPEPGMTVCDPFMGSGTTGVAAVQMGRNFIGCEIEPRHFASSCKRIEDAQRQGDFFVEQAA